MRKITESYHLTPGQKIGLGTVACILGGPLLFVCQFILTGAIKLLTSFVHPLTGKSHARLFYEWTSWQSSVIIAWLIYAALVACIFWYAHRRVKKIK